MPPKSGNLMGAFDFFGLSTGFGKSSITVALRLYFKELIHLAIFRASSLGT